MIKSTIFLNTKTLPRLQAPVAGRCERNSLKTRALLHPIDVVGCIVFPALVDKPCSYDDAPTYVRPVACGVARRNGYPVEHTDSCRSICECPHFSSIFQGRTSGCPGSVSNQFLQ